MDDDISTIAMFNPGFAARMQQQQDAYLKSRFEDMVKKKQQVAWDDTTTKFTPELLIDGKTWNPTVLWDTPALVGSPLERMKPSEQAKLVWSPSGKFFYANHHLPRGCNLSMVQGNRKGRVWFTSTVNHPVLCEVKPNSKYGSIVWMGLTPMEVFTQRAGVRLASGRVVIGGLGLGWFLNAVCAKKTVTQIIVVDREKELLDWLVPRIVDAYPHVKDRMLDAAFGTKNIRFEHADIYEFIESDKANWFQTKYLIDIWDSYRCYDHKFHLLEKQLGKKHLWGWGQIAER